MQNLVIIGARGSGRGVLESIRQGRMQGDFVVKGFLDDNMHAFDGLIGDFPPIICSVEDYTVESDEVFFCALGNSHSRRQYVEIIEKKGGRFCSLISKEAYINRNSIIHDGSLIGEHTIIDDNVVIGNHSVIHPFCIIGHNSIIGDFASIESFSFVGGNSKIGNGVSLHARSTIIPHISIEEQAVVGVGSVVIKNISKGVHVFGNPAKKIIY